MNLIDKEIVERYKVVEKIGEGGMACVYKAKDTVLNRYVALKVMKEEFVSDEEFVERFNKEAQAAAGLTHPNIVSIYDVGFAEQQNTYYIVMELVRGKTLKQIINEDGKLPWKWSVNIAIQIASALETAHKNGIIHRDIKPHNIMITEDGVAKVTDFGIAKAVSNSTITAFGTTIGSVHYFSPEHAKGGFTDAKSDLYSLGIVMYEMLTGKVPFDADTPVSIALKHMQEKAVEPMKLNPSVPLSVNQIIMKAMKKNPTLRYQNATEMLSDLKQSLKTPDRDFVKDGKKAKNSKSSKSEEDIYDDKAGSPDDYKDKNKQSGLKKFFKDHPELRLPAMISVFVVIFIIILSIILGVVGANSPKDEDVKTLIGMTKEDVENAFKDTKHQYEIIEEYNKEIEKGKVYKQEPDINGPQTKSNSKYKVWISKGSSEVTIPETKNIPFADVEKTLTGLELKIEKVEDYDLEVEAGKVIATEPAANTVTNKGNTIKVHISKGAEQVIVDTVLNKTEADATKILTDQKLKVKVEYEDTTDETKKDLVIRQNPTAGTTVSAGRDVYITVNRYIAEKTRSIHINVKKLTGNESNTNPGSKTAKIEIYEKNENGSKGDKIYSGTSSIQSEDLDTGKTITGRGTRQILVYVDGGEAKNYSITMDTDDIYTIS